MKILVDRARCAGHARCHAAAPELFRLDDDGYIGVESFQVAAGLEEAARRGAQSCPERALRIEPETQSEAP